MAHNVDEQLRQAIDNHFACARCGACCKGDGLVHCSAAEIERLADQVGMTRRQFVRRFAVRERDEWILKDKLIFSGNPSARPEKWCVFLDRGADGLYGCIVDDAKPEQCKEFPAKWINPDSMQTCVGLRNLKKSQSDRNPKS